MSRRRLRDGDLAETSFRLKLAVPMWLMVVLVATMLHRVGTISRGAMLLMIWIAGPVLALALAEAVSALLGGVARGLLGSLIAQGGDPMPRGYSEQEALVIGGRPREAVDSYRALLVAYPDDVEARIRLATLLERLGDRDEALAAYGAARAARPPAALALRISTGLAALHRRAGDRDALRAELARCARDFPGTASGEAARRELEAS